MALIATFKENFNFGGRDTGKFDDPGSGNVAMGTDLNLQITTASGGAYYTLSSTATFDLTGSSSYIQLVDAGNQSITSLEVYPVHLGAGDNSVSIMISGNTVYARKKVSTVSSTVGSGVAYNSMTMKWFRIREASGTTYWEYAATPTGTWTQIASAVNPITITALHVEVVVGTWQAEGSTTTAIFDNINTTETEYQFSWKGYTWEKRIHAGPPANNQTFAAANVTGPDGSDYLTFSLSNAGSAPIGCEIFSVQRGFGYGTYMSVIGTRLDTMDHKIGFGGLFTFDFTDPADYKEIDTAEIRDYNSEVNMRILHSHVWDNSGQTFITDDMDVNAASVQTHIMRWEPGRIQFDSYTGAGTGGTNYFHTEHTTNIPTPGLERVHFNIWSNTAVAGYTTATPIDVVVRDFSFTPLYGSGGNRTGISSLKSIQSLRNL